MTTISTVNIVVQQGDKARDAAQSIKSQSMDPSQLTAAEQQEKERTSLSSVPESEESDAINPDKQQREKNKKIPKIDFECCIVVTYEYSEYYANLNGEVAMM